MAINLKEIPEAVKSYLNNQVTVVISAFTPSGGTSIQPNEKFSFLVVASNASAAQGGIALTKVRYRVAVDNPAVVGLDRKAFADVASKVTDLDGKEFENLDPPYVGGLIVTPKSDHNSYNLGIGNSDSLPFAGKAGSAAAGGNTTIRARILADVDLNLLFPKNEDTPTTTKAIQVVG